jgi:hypothetical protein
MMRIERIFADLIRLNPLNPRHPRAIYFNVERDCFVWIDYAQKKSKDHSLLFFSLFTLLYLSYSCLMIDYQNTFCCHHP